VLLAEKVESCVCVRVCVLVIYSIGRSTRKFFQGQRGKTPAGRYTTELR